MSKNFFTVYDDNSYYLIDSAFMIVVNKEKRYIKSLSAILSSNVLDFYMKLLADVLRGKTLAVKKIYVEQLPIVEISEENQIIFSQKVDEIMLLNKQYHSINTPAERKIIQQQIDFLDQEINQKVYELYDLTDEEIEIIESNL